MSERCFKVSHSICRWCKDSTYALSCILNGHDIASHVPPVATCSRYCYSISSIVLSVTQLQHPKSLVTGILDVSV